MTGGWSPLMVNGSAPEEGVREEKVEELRWAMASAMDQTALVTRRGARTSALRAA